LRRGPCLVSYADIVYSPAVIEGLSLTCSEGLTVVYDRLWRELWEMRSEDPLSDAETFRTNGEGSLAEIGRRPKSLDEVEGQYLGLVRWTPQAWRQAEQILEGLSPERRERLDMTSLIQMLLDGGACVSTFPVDGKWCEVDSQADRDRYEARLALGPWSHDWRDTVTAP
jgi:choline kinase